MSDDSMCPTCGRVGALCKWADGDAIHCMRWQLGVMRSALTEIARLGVDMSEDFSRSAMQSKIAREALA